MMGHREKMNHGDEYDVVHARHRYCYLDRPRVAHTVKKKMSRRIRREAKRTLTEEVCRADTA